MRRFFDILKLVLYIQMLRREVDKMAKTITCTAVLDHDLQIENLRQCIEILGGDPIVNQNTVKVTAPYPSEIAERLIMLYEHYWRHTINISKN